MNLMILLCSLLAGYFLGSISFGQLFMRFFKPGENLDDVALPIAGVEETYKIESVGGNTISKYGARAGCAVSILDILKAFVPTLAFKLLFPDQPYFLVAALAAFIGHNWPVFHQFKGGRGISPFYGGLFGFDPLGALVVAVTSLVFGMVVLRELLVAYAGGVLFLIPWIFVTRYRDPLFPYYLAYIVLINVLMAVAMIPEIRQIITLRQKYGKQDMFTDMGNFPMGKHMLKLMRRLGLEKNPENKTDSQSG